MLKPADNPQADEERPIGEIVSDLVDEGKAYARAELNLAKATALAKVEGFKVPAILLAAAALVGMAAINVLAVAIFVALALVMSPVLAGLLAFALVAGAAALLAWLGVRRMRAAK